MEKLYFLTIDGIYCGVRTESYCRAYCKQFARTRHINATELNASEIKQGQSQGFWTLTPRCV